MPMPAYVHARPYVATKLVSLNTGNTERGLSTLHAQVVLTDAETGQPAVFPVRQQSQTLRLIGLAGSQSPSSRLTHGQST